MAATCRSPSAITRCRSIFGDQIARTVIENRFVNHTNAELEGVFYFPLPAGPSISGFRHVDRDNCRGRRGREAAAREIYETILRETPRPGLLEWSGGTIFKARVFPMPLAPRSGSKSPILRCCRSKGAVSLQLRLAERMLQQTPLRDLSIDVKVKFGGAAQSVTSPTQPTRDERTAAFGALEFSAQEYTRRATSRWSSNSKAGRRTW